jgi:hypothetical protein
MTEPECRQQYCRQARQIRDCSGTAGRRIHRYQNTNSGIGEHARRPACTGRGQPIEASTWRYDGFWLPVFGRFERRRAAVRYGLRRRTFRRSHGRRKLSDVLSSLIGAVLSCVCDGCVSDHTCISIQERTAVTHIRIGVKINRTVEDRQHTGGSSAWHTTRHERDENGMTKKHDRKNKQNKGKKASTSTPCPSRELRRRSGCDQTPARA